MKRAHRAWHWRIWLILPVVVAVLFVASLLVRPNPPGRLVPWNAGAPQ